MQREREELNRTFATAARGTELKTTTLALPRISLVKHPPTLVARALMLSIRKAVIRIRPTPLLSRSISTSPSRQEAKSPKAASDIESEKEPVLVRVFARVSR